MRRWLILSLILTGCATTSRLDLTSLTKTPPFDRAYWAIHVEDDDGRVLYSENAGKLMMPASNRKLSASATIANCLGLDTQLKTEIWRDGEDLVIVGDGDPTLGSWRYERDDDFLHAAAALRERGITRVRDVVTDVSRFDRMTIPYGWKSGYLGEPYAAPVDAVAWNENGEAGRAIQDPPGRAARAMIDALVMSGIEVTGAARTETAPRAWQEKLLEIPSPFVAQMLTTVLKNSQNLYTEMLFKRSGGGTYANAFALDRAFLTTEAGLDARSFRFADGSGLSPDNLVAAEATVKLLRWMNEPSRRGFWWSILAQPANEGTLRRRLLPLEHRFRGKTGTIGGVAALSGILDMGGGRYRYFSIMVNHHTGEDAEKIIDQMVARIAQ